LASLITPYDLEAFTETKSLTLGQFLKGYVIFSIFTFQPQLTPTLQSNHFSALQLLEIFKAGSLSEIDQSKALLLILKE
jgi:hypothetical protein